MQINQQLNNKHSIQAYDDTSVKIDNMLYQQSLIISNPEIISDWPIHTINEFSEDILKPLLTYQPNIIIIGHNQPSCFLPPLIMQELLKQRIGIEVMSIGAACRTFNVLLSEQREVALGIIFKK